MLARSGRLHTSTPRHCAWKERTLVNRGVPDLMELGSRKAESGT